MTDAVSWVVVATIKDGCYDDLVTLIGEMVSATKNDEPGTLAYEWFASDDRKSLHIYERYADNAAVMVHLGNFGAKFGQRFSQLLHVDHIAVYGKASDEVMKALKPMGAYLLTQVDGFAR